MFSNLQARRASLISIGEVLIDTIKLISERKETENENRVMVTWQETLELLV